VIAVELTLIPPSGQIPSLSDAEAVRDALWAHASSDYEITHITTTPRQQQIDVMIFVRSADANPEAALTIARKLVSISPSFGAWTVQRTDFHSS
jgi:hypothetical protein